MCLKKVPLSHAIKEAAARDMSLSSPQLTTSCESKWNYAHHPICQKLLCFFPGIVGDTTAVSPNRSLLSICLVDVKVWR